jgi:uncharacterized repeat protein (TIGR01451 family)
MKTKKRLSVLLLAGLILMVATGVGIAQRQLMLANTARPEVKVSLSATVERDSKVMTLDKSVAVEPGEVLTWTVEALNVGDAPAIEYRTVAQIPPGTEYLKGSARAEGATAMYSIDGGKSFSQQPMVDQRQADGSVKVTPAPLSMYTSIRYEWANPLAQGAKVSASYQVRVK